MEKQEIYFYIFVSASYLWSGHCLNYLSDKRLPNKWFGIWEKSKQNNISTTKLRTVLEFQRVLVSVKFASQPTTTYINIHHPQTLTYIGARMQMQFWFSIVETAGTLLTLPIPNILLSREYPVSTSRRWVVVVAKVTRCEVWGAGSVLCPLLYFISHILLLPKHSNKDTEKKPNTTNINCVIAALKQCWLSLNDLNDGMICRNHQ